MESVIAGREAEESAGDSCAVSNEQTRKTAAASLSDGKLLSHNSMRSSTPGFGIGFTGLGKAGKYRNKCGEKKSDNGESSYPQAVRSACG